ncbi:hypothetical protein ASF82_03585 [Frigoribacterium sp. Leaf164]|nr:hypothetical protein ASF82_03585 [Frigoribacterium sp. Leaf164]
MHLGDDRAAPAGGGQVREHLGDRLRARARHEVLVDEAARPGRDGAVAEVDVTEALAERQREVEGVAARDGGVREVERGRRHVEADRVVSGGVDVGDDRAEAPREHVLDGELDARRGLHVAHDLDEAGGDAALPAERRVHDDGRRPELRGQLGRAQQLVALVATQGEVGRRQHRRVHRQRGQAPPGDGGAEQRGVAAAPVGGHHHLDAAVAHPAGEAEGLVGRSREDAGRAHADRDHAARLRPGRDHAAGPSVNVGRTAGQRGR